MAYQVPLRFIRIAPNTAICATRIVCLLDSNSSYGYDILRREKQNKTLVNCTGKRKTRTLIVMDSGTVIAAPYTVSEILKRIENADTDFLKGKVSTTRPPKRLRVYDVYDEEPSTDALQSPAMTTDLATEETDSDEIDPETT